tara:strand:+ start:397 stop:1632 length:1236 start_codon:yes stop_codon:yes gene_type:complete
MQIKALPHQYNAIQAFKEYSHVLMLGGVGSGKTYTLCLFLLEELRRWHEGDKSIGLITANSYGQLRRSVLTEVFKNMQDWGISFEYNQQQSLLTLNRSKKFFCVSVDPGSIEKIRGITVGSVVQDEALYIKDIDTYNTVQGRIRDKQGSGRTLLCSSPNGFNWGYDLFKGELHNPKTHKIIKAKTKDNRHILDSFYDSMTAQLDEKGIQQELEGEFVSRAGGQVYYQFDRTRNVKEIKWTGQLGFIGLDFNVDPFCATVCLYDGGKFYVFDEIYMTGGSDTYMMASELKRRGYGAFKVIADSTYVARKTSGKSDKRILEGAGFECMATRNPFVTDRCVNANRLFASDRVIIDPKCKKLINDLEQVTFKDNGQIDPGPKRELGHITDSLAYILWRLSPIEVSIKQRAFSIKR